MSETELQRQLRKYGPSIDEEIRQRLSVGAISPEFTSMMAYPFGYVDEHLRPIATSGGKRFRPLLCLLTCEAVGGAASQALIAAVAIEMLHTFSLVHDDIEDRDATRRHRPTVWKLWGEAQGINVGDGIFAVAGRTILDVRCDPAVVLAIAQRFADTARALTEGQHLDMSFETHMDVQIDEYAAMVENKTGSLIDFSVWVGARVGGADEETLSAMSTFGSELGKAFQIYDDISGIWASQDRTGKEFGKDLRNGKKTLPVLLAAEHASEPSRSVLTSYMRGEPVDTTKVLDAVNHTRARAYAEERADDHMDKARHALSRARVSPAQADTLLALAADLTGQPASS